MINKKTSSDLYAGDLFKLRNKIVSDYYMKRKIDQIGTRKNQFLNDNKNQNRKIENENSTKRETELVKKTGLNNSLISSSVILPEILMQAVVMDKKKPQLRNKSMKEHMMESRRVNTNIRNEQIVDENYKFAKRLFRIKSPLGRDKMNDSFNRSRDYKELAKKIKNFSDVTKKVVKSFQLQSLVLKSPNDVKIF